MITITKYKAVDGSEFDSSQECKKYELLIDRVNSIMALLPRRQNSRL